MASMRHTFVNTRLIDKTIESIRKGPFDMGAWDCCIAGHAVRAKHGGATNLLDLAIGDNGRRALGLSINEACELFARQMGASKAEAIRCLEILRDEGVVDWKRATSEVANEELKTFASPYTWQAQGLDRLHAEFDRLCEEARALA